jgi:hypothetical protein
VDGIGNDDVVAIEALYSGLDVVDSSGVPP